MVTENTGDPLQQDAFKRIEGYLGDFGLATPALTSWLWSQIKENHSIDIILADLRGRPEWKARFPGNELRREKGLPLMSPETYVQWETNARQSMRAAGMPEGFYDTPDDFAKMVGHDISINELQDRIDRGYAAVMDAPQQVKDAFFQFYGTNTDGALAAYFLDSERATPLLLKQARAAQAKGYGSMNDFTISQQQSEFVADLDISEEQLRQGYQQLGEIRGVFSETVGEAGQDLEAGAEGVEAAFGAGTGQEKIAKRLEERKAALGGQGGSLKTQQGFTGLGAAEST